MEQLSQKLAERLTLAMSKYNVNISDVNLDIIRILNDYDIQPKSEAIVVYTQGKNEIYLKRFMLAKAVAGCSQRTIENYRISINKFLSDIKKDADCITSTDVQVYLANLIARGVTKSYADTMRRYLSTFYAFLHREELIGKNPMLKIDKIKFHREKETAFSDMEIEKIRKACKDARETAIIELLLSTGCRASEAVNIKVDDIKEDKILVYGKGGKYRIVYLNARCILALSAYLKERKDKNPYLFPACIIRSCGENLKKSIR